jgi:trans-aconitate 2-methyltransferase
MSSSPPSGEWRWDAQCYSENSSAQRGWAQELFAKLLLNGAESVLDIGCGDGRVSRELARLVPRGEVVGVDNSPSMIEKACASEQIPGAGSGSFLLMDARELSFTERFDVAFSNAALHWVIDQRPVLRGVARALKLGGRLLFQMGGKGNAAGVVEVFEELRQSDPWRRYFERFRFPWGFYDPQEYRGLCEETGLRVSRAELLPRDMRYPSAGGFAGWIRTTWMPYTHQVPAELREGLIWQAVELYRRRHPAQGGEGVCVAMVRLEVEARRG